MRKLSVVRESDEGNVGIKIKFFTYLILMLHLLSTLGCITISRETVLDMPNASICEFLSPAYVTTTKERMILYRELERRGKSCDSSGWSEMAQRNDQKLNEVSNTFIPHPKTQETNYSNIGNECGPYSLAPFEYGNCKFICVNRKWSEVCP